jgi:hypothetical protein
LLLQPHLELLCKKRGHLLLPNPAIQRRGEAHQQPSQELLLPPLPLLLVLPALQDALTCPLLVLALLQGMLAKASALLLLLLQLKLA